MKGTDSAAPIQSDEEDEGKQPNCLLLEPDFQLMQALMESQQNFTISDPSMPDNPIVYASQVITVHKQDVYVVLYLESLPWVCLPFVGQRDNTVSVVAELHHEVALCVSVRQRMTRARIKFRTEYQSEQTLYRL